jgi:anti-anti-sigma factor
VVQGQPRPFSVEVEWTSGVPVVAVCGEVDIATVPYLEEQLNELVDKAPPQVVLDLGEMDFIDCAGAAVIARARRRLPDQECEVVLRCPKPLAQRIFELTGLDGSCVIEAAPEPATGPTSADG